MSTGQNKSNIYLKKFLPQDQMTVNFLEYLAARDLENLKLQYPNQGFFVGLGLTGSDPDEVEAATPSITTDGQGNLLKLDPANAKAKFQNNLGDTYWVGMRYNALERGTEVNVRTGRIEYRTVEDSIGEKAEPNLVVDNGTTLRLRVDSLFEAGVSHAGRSVICYLKNAVSQADAFFVGTVQFIGGFNVVDTTHLLGQTAGLVDTDPTKYWVFASGLTIRKTDITTDPSYVFFGTVIGAGAGNTPSTIDTTGATPLYGGEVFTTLVNILRSFLTGGGSIEWDLASEQLTLGASLFLRPASVPYAYEISPAVFSSINDGDCGYIELDGVGGVVAITQAPLADVPDAPKFLPIFLRAGNDLFFINGALELQGDSGSTTTGRIDGTTQDLLDYIGASSESDADPDYEGALGGTKKNIHLVQAESLTKSIKRLELRNDVVTKVKAIDLNATVLPAGVSVTIDGQVIANGDLVLFANAALNKVYQASGIGVAVVWTAVQVFGNSDVPQSMSLIAVKESNSEVIRNIWQYTTAIGWKLFNLSEIMSEPTGFPDRNSSTFSFVAGTRTFTIQPVGAEFYYYQKGRIFKKTTAQNVIIPDAEGVHYIYFDGQTLLSTQIFTDDLLKIYTFVATIYWDATNDVAILLSEERHSLTMDGMTHAYLHNTEGMRWVNGLGLTYSTGDGSSDTHAQILLADGTLYDEDIPITPTNAAVPAAFFEQILDPIAQIPIMYRSGAAGDWRKFAANNFISHLGSARATYNNPAGPWTTPDATANGNFIAMWVFSTNDVNHPIVAIMGQREDTTLNDAQLNNLYETLSFGNLPSLEMKVLYRVIFQTSSAFANTPKTLIADVRDLRRAVDVSLGAYTPSAHNLLSARNAPNAHTASAISTVTTSFGGALSASDTESQTALNTLDAHFKQLRLQPHPSLLKRVIITGASVPLNTGTVLEQQLSNLILKFTGAQIDFSTGVVYESDGVTVFNGGANNFTPIVPAATQFRWLAVTLVASTSNADNTINASIIVTPAQTDGASQALAARAAFASGLKLGQVATQEASGSIANIAAANITRQGTGGSGDGSGSSEVNYLTSFTPFVSKNTVAASTPDAGFITAGTNITFADNSTAPLRGLSDKALVKDAANRQGQQVVIPFIIDIADQGKVLDFSMDYKIFSGTYADGDVTFHVYDVTNAAFLIQPVPNSLLTHLLPSERFACQFQTAINSTSYRLIMHVASASALAYQLRMDNFKLGPNQRSIATFPQIKYYNTVSTITGVNTVTADTPVDVPNATLTLSEIGDYELIYEAYLGISSNNGERVGVSAAVMITDNANALVDEAKQLFTATISATGRSHAAPVRAIARISITGAAQTFKVRLVNGESAANSVAQTGFADPTGSLSGNDTTNKFYARRIVTTQHQILDDGYSTRSISFKAGKETAQSIPDGTWTKVTGWAAPDHDTVGGFLGDTYTVKSAGLYEVEAQVTFSTNASGTRNALIRKNSENLATPRASAAFNAAPPPQESSAPVSSTDWYNVGDIIEIWALQTSGVSLTVSTSGGYNLFSVKKLPNPAQVIQPLIYEYTEADKIRNYIINGNFELWQRADAFKLFGSTIEYHADRLAWTAGTITGIVKSEKMPISTFSNSAILPKSCRSMQRYEVSTAQAVLGAAATAAPRYKIEGYDFAQMLEQGALQRGFTLSFYTGATVGGTYTIELFNSATDRRYFKPYTIVGGSTWQRINIHFTAAEVAAGISSGIWDYATLSGLGFRFWLAAGTDSHGGTQNAWTGSANVPAAQVNFLATVNNWWGITGLMVNTGKVLADFRTMGKGHAEELQLARRYFEKTYRHSIDVGGANVEQILYISNTSTIAQSPVGTWFYKAAKRAAPSFTFYNASTGATTTWRTTGAVDHTMSLINNFENYASYQASTGIAAGVAIVGHATADAEL